MISNLFSTRFRLTLGIVSIVLTVLLVAAWVKIVPDAETVTRESRIKLSETAALVSGDFIRRSDLDGLHHLLGNLVSANDELLSAGIRVGNGKLLVDTGNHGRFWKEEQGSFNGRQAKVPVVQSKHKQANVELVFMPLHLEGWAGWRNHPWVRLGTFVGAGSFLSITLYFSLMMRQLNAQRPPPNRVRYALDNLAEGLLLLDRHGRIVMANESFLSMAEMPRERALGTSPSRLEWLDENENPCESLPWETVLQTGQTVLNRLMRLDRKNSESAIYKVNCTAIGGGDTPDGVMVCLENVTQLDKAEGEVRRSRDQAEATSRANSEFLANLSREIRTPLHAILGFTDLLQRGMAKTYEEQSEYLSTIQSSGSQLLELFNDILDLSKIEAGKMEMQMTNFSPFEVIGDVTNILGARAQKKNISLSFEAGHALPETIRTDPDRFRQVLTNLIGNAIKFTDSGGVKVTACVSCRGDQSYLHVDVIDTGIGMTPDQMKTIFDPFTQAGNSDARRHGGTGLGLSISQRIVRELGGDLNAKSISGQGSVFSFEVAIGALEDVRMIEQDQYINQLRFERAGGSLNDKLTPCRILVVDDGAANRRLISLFLGRAGCTVEQAENGQVAIEKIQQQDFDVVLMDMQMPVMDGYQATTRLREIGFDRPVFALTANAMPGDERKCLNAGCSGFLAKPVNMDKLVEMISESREGKTETVTCESSESISVPGNAMATEEDSEINGFQGVLKIGLEAMTSARQRKDDTSFVQVCEELRDAANAFGKMNTANCLAALVEAVQARDTVATNKQLMRFQFVAAEEANENTEFAPVYSTLEPASPPADSVDEDRKIFSRLPMDEPEFREIVIEFVPALETKIAEMVQHESENQFEQLAQLAHWLKGAGGTVGFDEFYQPAVELENAGKASQIGLAKLKIEEISLLCQAIEIPDCESTQKSA